ncbi:MAG: glutamate mutase L [Solirubrobacterales bacterium]
MLVVGDIGSTFTKMVGVSESGELLGSVRVPTSREDLAGGVARARERLVAAAGRAAGEADLILSSSAGGGLRIVVLGMEPALTLAAGQRTSATAGARIVASYGAGETAAATSAGFAAAQPDIALLTGGTDGGDAKTIVEHAEALRTLAPGLPVVVAGNRAAQPRVREALGEGRVVRCVDNVMPRVGELRPESAQAEIRSLFVEHVIGHGRFSSASELASAIRMPTPAAVLAATAAIGESAAHGEARFPVVVDIGGATTDVHSALPLDPSAHAYVATGLAESHLTRTVEGDLGMRENAPGVLEAAALGGLPREELAGLEEPVARRAADRAFVPADEAEREVDRRLAEIAAEVAVLRHAGRLRTVLTDEGAALIRDGRDLRPATCFIATGGVFAHAAAPARIVETALARVRGSGGLVPASVPVRVDRDYLLWAVGLLARDHREAALGLLESVLGGER